MSRSRIPAVVAQSELLVRQPPDFVILRGGAGVEERGRQLIMVVVWTSRDRLAAAGPGSEEGHPHRRRAPR